MNSHEFQVLPPEFGIVCTHPMFGPESGKNGWASLPFVYDKVRIADNGTQDRKCAQFLSIFENEVSKFFSRFNWRTLYNLHYTMYLTSRILYNLYYAMYLTS